MMIVPINFSKCKDFNVYFKSLHKDMKTSDYIYNIIKFWNPDNYNQICKMINGIKGDETEEIIEQKFFKFFKCCPNSFEILNSRIKIDVLKNTGFNFSKHACIRFISRFFFNDILKSSCLFEKYLRQGFKEKEEFIAAGDIGMVINPYTKTIITIYPIGTSKQRVNKFKTPSSRKEYMQNRNILRTLDRIKYEGCDLNETTIVQ